MRRGLFLFAACALWITGFTGVAGQALDRTGLIARSARILSSDIHFKSGPLQGELSEYQSPSGSPVYVATFGHSGFVIWTPTETGYQPAGWSLTALPQDPGHPVNSFVIPRISLQGGLKSTRNGNLKRSSMSTDDAVQPLVKAQWGQGDSWNQFCPADSTGRRALVGCVAVAMAQIMHYWEYPETGTGTIEYIPMSHPYYGEIRLNLDTVRYDWGAMHDIWPTRDAARLLFHSAAAARMNFGPTESATSVDGYGMDALRNHFRYQPGTIFRSMDDMPYADWIELLRQELANGRPVLYTGMTPDGKVSHAFNIDGFRDTGFFHFNWGWSGAGDGWYNLESMAGGNSAFTDQQAAIFGLQPVSKPLHDRPTLLDVMPGDGFVRLFWQNPVMADLSHYVIYRDSVQVELTATPNFRDEGVENGKSYRYTVTAVYAGQSPGESAHTPSIIATPWQPLTPGYQQVFDAGLQGWQLQGNETGFRLGEASELGIGGNTTRIAGIRSDQKPQGSHTADYLTSPVIYPSEYTHLAISFDYLYKSNPDTDMFFLMYRDFLTGVWQPVIRLDSTGGWSDWKNIHVYLPKPLSNAPIQVAFYYNDFYGNAFGAAVDNIRIYEVPVKTVPAFEAASNDICHEQFVRFTDKTTGPATEWEWDFGEGAQPRYAFTKGPHDVFYQAPGNQTVKLSVNRLDHLEQKDFLRVRNKPHADYSYVRNAMTIRFTSLSTHHSDLEWHFGDGGTSTELNPVHTYYSKELFEVKLIALNGPCQPDTLIRSLDLRNGTGIEDIAEDEQIEIWPNPTRGTVNLRIREIPGSPILVRLMTLTGQVLYSQNFSGPDTACLELFSFPEGIYILHITAGDTTFRRRIVKI